MGSNHVRGLTTDAAFGVVAAIGLLSGAGFLVVAIGSTVISLLMVSISAVLDQRVFGGLDDWHYDDRATQVFLATLAPT